MQFLIHEIKFTPSVPHFNRTDWYRWSGNLREKKTYKHSAQQLEPKNAKRFKKFFSLWKRGNSTFIVDMEREKAKEIYGNKRWRESRRCVKGKAIQQYCW